MTARRRALASAAGMGIVIAALSGAYVAGLRVNNTASAPRGLWRVVRTGAPLRRGQVVTICPPDTPAVRLGRERGYIRGGSCPGNFEPLVKPVAAVAGDVVTVTADGISVNGVAVAGIAPLSHDSAGRELRPIPPGTYRVGPGEVWLLSGHVPNSWDSRYLGPLPASGVLGIARPVWVSP